jgi:hypothetical protein
VKEPEFSENYTQPKQHNPLAEIALPLLSEC